MDCDFVATCPHSAPTGLGPFLMSAHTGAKKKPATNTWPCLPTGTDPSPSPTEGIILPDADSGQTLGTQPPPAKLGGQVGELAAELGVGWTGESHPPPGVALEAVRQSSPRQESVETVSVNNDRVPVASQWSDNSKFLSNSSTS